MVQRSIYRDVIFWQNDVAILGIPPSHRHLTEKGLVRAGWDTESWEDRAGARGKEKTVQEHQGSKCHELKEADDKPVFKESE